MVGKRHRIWTDIDKDKLGQGGRETELRILGFGNEGIGYLTFPFQAKNFLLYSQYVRTMTKVVIELLGQLIMLSVLIFQLSY